MKVKRIAKEHGTYCVNLGSAWMLFETVIPVGKE
jgi:hypothetical protein